MSEKDPLKARFSYLLSAAATDIGRVRAANEDAVLNMPERGLFCIADGMGGGQAGDVASQAVVESLREAFAERQEPGVMARRGMVRTAVQEANRRIKEYAARHRLEGIGTTVVVLLFTPDAPADARAYHAGDSRLYRFRNGRLSKLTTDHSFVEEAGIKNEEDLPAFFRGLVTRAVGVEDPAELEETVVEAKADDVFMLCSDGLTRMLPEPLIAGIMRRHAEKEFEILPKLLVKAANNAGGVDNISVIVVKIQPPAA